MKKIEKQYYIEKLDDILHSPSSNLSKEDRDRIIIVREYIKHEDDKAGLLKLIATIWDCFT